MRLWTDYGSSKWKVVVLSPCVLVRRTAPDHFPETLTKATTTQAMLKASLLSARRENFFDLLANFDFKLLYYLWFFVLYTSLTLSLFDHSLDHA